MYMINEKKKKSYLFLFHSLFMPVTLHLLLLYVLSPFHLYLLPFLIAKVYVDGYQANTGGNGYSIAKLT